MRAPRGNGAAFGPRMKWIVIGLAAIALAATASFSRELVRGRQIDREIAGLEREAERLRAKNFEIASLYASMNNGEFLEREARLKLNLRKEGERVVVLRKEETSPAPDEDGPASRSLGEGWSNPKRWWMYFADRRALEEYANNERRN